MRTHTIKSFSIYGLFGTKDIHIPFDENIKILIGENGIGKTQILNLLYYTLTRNFIKLSEIHFNRLVISFGEEDDIVIDRKDLISSQEIYRHPKIRRIIQIIGLSSFVELQQMYNSLEDGADFHVFEDRINSISRKSRMSRASLHRIIREIGDEVKTDSNTLLSSYDKDIHKCTNKREIMYFPTYRRVEEDLHNLGYNEEKLKINQNTLIQFGMNDVKEQFREIEQTIEILLKEGLKNFTKDILKIATSQNLIVDKNIFERTSPEDVELIFARAGTSLEEETKNAVKEAVRTKNFSNPLSGLLLQKLIELYERQKLYDNSIKQFRDICNKYLIEKEIFYDESNIDIYIRSTITDEKIRLSDLSSGKKQIISIFSKIYLSDKDKRFMVLFDEPELSLSIIWQKTLLPDIINSGKCDFMCAVTHSPFIFENELDQYAVGLNEYIQISSPTNDLFRTVRK